MTMAMIDLYSDTQTKPTPAMRQIMAEAKVGDEQQGTDPTVNLLCEKAAVLLGKERAVFMPSGTMCNQISVAVHCRPGDEVIADASAHVVNTEGGGLAVFAGSLARVIDGDRGVYSADALAAAIRMPRRHAPRSRLVVVEQTSNAGGGTIWPLEAINAVAKTAREHDLLLHMDGARLMNAVVATGVSAAEFAAPFDSVWLDFSKGLGCPVGAILAGSNEFIHEAWQWKQRMGGAMRQAGIIAAAGIHALDEMVDRLAEDHENARWFAEALGNIPGIRVEEGVDTNMVFFNIEGTGVTAEDFSSRLIEGHGIRIGANDRFRMRAVTHHDVARNDLEQAAAAVREVAHAVAA